MNSENEEAAVLARYADGPEQLERAIAGLNEPNLDARVSQDGWTVRQVVHHVSCIRSGMRTSSRRCWPSSKETACSKGALMS
jgi:hypothetical protein